MERKERMTEREGIAEIDIKSTKNIRTKTETDTAETKTDIEKDIQEKMARGRMTTDPGMRGRGRSMTRREGTDQRRKMTSP